MDACASSSFVQSVCFKMPEITNLESTGHTVPRPVSRIDTISTTSTLEHSLPPDLCFVAEGSRRRLPGWARFYATLGSFLSFETDERSRLVIGLALPVRTFAAVFCTLGLVRSLALRKHHHVEQADAHFEYLLSLPVGTPVSYRKGQVQYRGILKPRPRKREIGIQIENERGGNTTKIITSPKVALRISPLEVDKIRLPRSQQGRQIRGDTSFIEAFIPGADAAEYLSRSFLDGVIVGRVNRLEEEICETRFVVGMAKGYLQDVLRVRRFLRPGEAYRTEIYPSTGNKIPAFPGEKAPHLVIFDGARGFLKWHAEMQGFHRVVMLERFDPEFDDALILLKQQSMSRIGEVDLSALPEPPAGVELIAYRIRSS